MNKGFLLVRPLEGGLDAWAEAGFPIDSELPEPPPPSGRFPTLPTRGA